MIITSRKEVFYKIEMTAQQAHNLQLLLQTGADGHVNELSITEQHGEQTGDEVRETARDLLHALENR
jgi:hypothetical protein